MSHRDVVSDAAEAARVVVHLEIAYDIVDELASSPERYVDSLAKLSRLAVKVHDDLKRLEKQETDSNKRAYYSRARERVENWGKLLNDLFNYFGKLNEKERREEVKRFAALAVSPDWLVNAVKEAMER